MQSMIWLSLFTAGFIIIWLTLRQMGQQLLAVNFTTTKNA
jgi:ferrous iron transport protein B